MESKFCEIGGCVGFERALLLYGVLDVVLVTVGMFTRTSIGCWKGTGNEASVVPIYAKLRRTSGGAAYALPGGKSSERSVPLLPPHLSFSYIDGTIPRKPRLSLRSVFESGVFSEGAGFAPVSEEIPGRVEDSGVC